MRVEEVMTRNPVTVSMDTSVAEVARMMAEKDVGFIPIVDGQGRAIGTVTDRDIVVRVVAKALDPKTAKLRDFGGNQVVYVRPQDDVSRARELMQQHKVQRILVCDDQQKPVGVIGLQDLARAADESEVGETVRKVKEEGAPARH
jgi:CBS domain-containing protein